MLRKLLPFYARYSARQASVSARLDRLDQALEKTGERHTEQIERLEDIVCELVLAVEALRREIGEARSSSAQPSAEAQVPEATEG